MARPFFSLALSLLLILTGCEDNLPKSICLDPDFSDADQARIIQTIEEVNSTLGRDLFGPPVIIFTGVCSGHQPFSVQAFEDNEHRIYLGLKTDPAFAELNQIVDAEVAGFATAQDVVLFPEVIDSDGFFRLTVLHELGHFLELAHINDPDAVMAPARLRNSEVSVYTTLDKQAFCLIHKCRYSP